MKYLLHNFLLFITVTSFWSMYSMRIADICNDQNEDVIVISSESNQESNRVNEIVSYETAAIALHDNKEECRHSESAKFYSVLPIKGKGICSICKTRKKRPYHHFAWSHSGCRTCYKVFYSREDILAHIKEAHDTQSKQEIITALTEKIEKKQNKNGESRIEAEALNTRAQLLTTPLDFLATVSLDKDILDIHQKVRAHIEKYQQSSEVNICDQENQVSGSNKNKRKKPIEAHCKACQRIFTVKQSLDRHMAYIHKACLTCNCHPFDSLSLTLLHFREKHPQKTSIITRLEYQLLQLCLEE